MILKKIWSYISFQKQPDFESEYNQIIGKETTDENSEQGFIKLPERKFTSMMHSINRISIAMFLIGIIVVLIKILK